MHRAERRRSYSLARWLAREFGYQSARETRDDLCEGVVEPGFEGSLDAGTNRLSVERLRLPGSREGADLTLAGRGVIGAGFALPRDAGRRPALHVLALFLRRRDAVSRPAAAVPV